MQLADYSQQAGWHLPVVPEQQADPELRVVLGLPAARRRRAEPRQRAVQRQQAEPTRRVALALPAAPGLQVGQRQPAASRQRVALRQPAAQRRRAVQCLRGVPKQLAEPQQAVPAAAISPTRPAKLKPPCAPACSRGSRRHAPDCWHALKPTTRASQRPIRFAHTLVHSETPCAQTGTTSRLPLR